MIINQYKLQNGSSGGGGILGYSESSRHAERYDPQSYRSLQGSHEQASRWIGSSQAH